MTTKTHNADWTVEVELPTQRWELQQLGAWDNTYGQLVKMDYATDATEGWCDAEDVAKLEADLAQMQRRVEDLEARLESKQASLGACKEANGVYADQLCEALNALRPLVEAYVTLTNSGDCGFGEDAELDPMVIAARKALEGKS